MPRPLSQALEAHVVDWRRLSWPLPWTAIYGRDAPLALEIGFGNGAFLEQEARAHPERDHVGVEVSFTAASHLLRRIERHALNNVRVLLAPAEVAVGLLLEPASLAAVFVNHPCPWPKKRHAARRLLRPDFVALLAARMRSGAPFLFVTDHAAYAASSRAVLEAQEALVSCHATSEIATIPGRAPTKYERKALDRGESIHYFEWRKEREPACVPPQPGAAPFHPEQADAMPTLTFRSLPADDALFAGFQSLTHQEEHRGVHAVVKLGPVYRELERPAWLIEALVLEDHLHQEFALRAARLPSSELLVKLAAPGRPHATHGVKVALWKLGEWLRARHPGLELVHETVGETVKGGGAR